MYRATAAMCRRLVPRRLAAAAWKYRTATGHLRSEASLAGGVRRLTNTSDGTDAAGATSAQEQVKLDPLFWKLTMYRELASQQHKEKTSISSKPDPAEDMEPAGPTLSYKLEDLMNNDFFKNQVKRIPTTFTSTRDYTESFKVPLLEETRADLFAALEDIRHAPVAQVVPMEKDRVWFKAATSSDCCYSPKDEDIVVFTHREKPTHYSHLKPYAIGVVRVVQETKDGKCTRVDLLSDTLRAVREHGGTSPLFAIFLINDKTSSRILDALSLRTTTFRDIGLIKKIAEYAPGVSQECNSFLPELPNSQLPDEALDGLEKFKLNTSQQKAVLDCVSAMEQDTSYWVRLICGPPGTGKTKTIVSLLWSMMIKNHRTLACAPTNTPVAEVATRILGIVEDDSYGGCGKHFSPSDVVLLGNKVRMTAGEKLANLFLEKRLSGLEAADWKHYVSCMLDLVEKPLTEYSSFSHSVRSGLMDFTLKHQGLGELERESMRQEQQKMTLKDFLLDAYEYREVCLRSCVEILRNHLPQSATSAESFRSMDELLNALEALGELMRTDPSRLRRKLFFKNSSEWPEFQKARALCVDKLKRLPDHCDLPTTRFEEYILNNAKIILCTTCSSSQLSRRKLLQKLWPLDLLVVDEAAQLRECELLIPL